MKLLHGGIVDAKPWAKERGLSYLMNAHRLEFETSGIILLAKSKPVLVELANLFGSEKPIKSYAALSQGRPTTDPFQIDAKLAPHPAKVGLMRVDPRRGKRATTTFKVQERFDGWTLLACQALTGRTHQIRVHFESRGIADCRRHAIWGETALAFTPQKGLSFETAQGRASAHRPGRSAREKLTLAHPVTGELLTIEAPWPKDLTVGLKYLRRFASVGAERAEADTRTTTSRSER